MTSSGVEESYSVQAATSDMSIEVCPEVKSGGLILAQVGLASPSGETGSLSDVT